MFVRGLWLLLACWLAASFAITSPVIGILGVPATAGCDVLGQGAAASGGSCFSSFYVQWLQGGGARIVPIPYNASSSELEYLGDNLNAVLFTGGGLDFAAQTQYINTAEYFFKKSIAAPASNPFPVWGTCMGFELLNYLAAGRNGSVLSSGFDAEDISLPLAFTSAAKASRLYSGLSDAVYQSFAEPITMNFHHEGVTPDTHDANPKLSSFYQVLSTSKDRQGRIFVSSMESLQGHIYGTQYHPERQAYEFNDYDTGLNHSFNSVRANNALAEFFVDQARLSTNSFATEADLDKIIIFNYPPVWQGHGTANFYYF